MSLGDVKVYTLLKLNLATSCYISGLWSGQPGQIIASLPIDQTCIGCSSGTTSKRHDNVGNLLQSLDNDTLSPVNVYLFFFQKKDR